MKREGMTDRKYKIGVAGCMGRMGRVLLATIATGAAQEGANFVLAGGAGRAGSDLIGKDLGELAGIGSLGLRATTSAEALFAEADAVIDFTAPAATLAHAALAAKTGTALIVGTTGMTDQDLETLEEASRSVAVVFARNMSLGVNLLLSLVECVSRILDDDYDIEILEMHHRHKVDAPSGTALALGEAAAQGRGVDLSLVAERVRDGIIGSRARGDIGFATLRGGDVIGDHSVIFAAEGERIEIGHRASNRSVFARGALKAALWLEGRPAGLYNMRDVLGLK